MLNNILRKWQIIMNREGGGGLGLIWNIFEFCFNGNTELMLIWN